MKALVLVVGCLVGMAPFFGQDVKLTLTQSATIDSLGACQGVYYQRNKAYLYGDREVGVIRTYTVGASALSYTGEEVKLTIDGRDVINHPTGIAHTQTGPTFIGNSVRPAEASPKGTKWRAVIYSINWDGLLRTRTLDGNLLNTIDDDAAIQGTRPEYVRYQNKGYVATADYGNNGNEVRLYDPARLAKAKRTSEPGMVVKKFTCSPWVQNLHWIEARGVLVLIQNQLEGRRWRFTFLDLNRSIEAGREQVIKTIDVDKADELEGFALLGTQHAGLAVTSSRVDNAHFVNLSW